MQALLWPDASIQELHHETDPMINRHSTSALPCVMLVSEDENGALNGFAQVGLRSHADGCNPERPVGFIEGWFVRAELRGQGIRRKLIESAEEWVRSQGCLEMASDALIDNRRSHDAHRALGFEVVDRCVHFRKNLSAPVLSGRSI